MTQGYAYSRDRAQALQTVFIRRVYNWMVIGLALTGVMAWFTAASPSLQQLVLGNRMLFFGLIIAELGLVFVLAGRAERMQPSTAATLFVIYSLLNGLTLSFIFLVYTRSTIATTFFVTAGTFGAMSVFGYTTSRDLTSWGSFLFMGLIGVVIASVVNIFLASAMIQWVVTYVGVLVFVGLTAYDTQRLKRIGLAGFADEGSEKRAAVVGALALYLDFINLFLMLLRILGNRN